MNHSLVLNRLVAMAALVALLTACDPGHEEHGDYTDKVQAVNAAEIAGWYADEREFRILDVRTKSEFEHDGHAPGAELVPWSYNDKMDGVNETFIQTVPERFGADETIVILCSLGMRASQAADELQRTAGFTRIYVFEGGYEGHDMAGFPSGPGWRASELPMDGVDPPREDLLGEDPAAEE
ncbi:MAG: rhodanese-like domain-containing protein [Gammaproteobacteria bacterium]